jgi:hypothetical protein
MICRLGGTTLLTRSIDITYWAMAFEVWAKKEDETTRTGASQGA